MQRSFDIFLSYRRSGGGFETANLLYNRLTHAGYRVFMDVESLRSGKFNKQLFSQIDACKDFIVVLGPDSLDRCVNEDDWVRLEVARAIEQGKNIIPIFLRGFTPPTQPLPKDIAELLHYEGLEASPQLFDAFLEKLKGMLASKRHLNWQRIKKPFLLVVFPVLLLVGLLLFIQLNKRHMEQKQVEQVCTQVISEISAGFVQGNALIAILQNADAKWNEFHRSLLQADNQQEKNRLKNELDRYLDFQLEQVEKTMQMPDMAITPAHEELLSKHGISVQDIKAVRPMLLADIDETRKFLVQVKYWLNSSEMGWPDKLDEAFSYLASMNIEMINGGLYAFNQLMIEMPETSQKAFFKFQPVLTNYTARVDFNAKKEQLEAEQQRVMKRCEELFSEYTAIIGDQYMEVEVLKNKLDSLKVEKKKLTVYTNPTIDSLKQVVAAKKAGLDVKRAEVEAKKTKIRESYQRVLQKCTFTKTEESGMMWGKIIFLARFALNQIETEDSYSAENVRLRNEAVQKGQDPNQLEPLISTISSKEIFLELQKRLDLYRQFNQSTDSNTAIYIPAAKSYYKLVADRKLEPVGVLIIGTADNQPHPLLKTGDIVITKKSEPVIDKNLYFALSKNEGANTQTLLRFMNGKKTTVTGTVPADCKVLVGVVDLWGEK